MGVNVLGPRKLRKLVRMTGLELDRALVYSHHENGRVAAARTIDHRHVLIDRETGEVWDDDSTHPCWSSCEKLDIPLNRTAVVT